MAQVIEEIRIGEKVKFRRSKDNTLENRIGYYDCNVMGKTSTRTKWESIKDDLTFFVLVKKENKGYIARCLELKGCWSEGESLKEVKKNIVEAIQLYLDIDIKPRINFIYE